MTGEGKKVSTKFSIEVKQRIPIMFSHGTGADIMKWIATPMVGGVITSTILELIIYPSIYMIWRGRRLAKD
jgi:Cu(I)/Ag(I) efflux system membrane protein CusA/SilA